MQQLSMVFVQTLYPLAHVPDADPDSNENIFLYKLSNNLNIAETALFVAELAILDLLMVGA